MSVDKPVRPASEPPLLRGYLPPPIKDDEGNVLIEMDGRYWLVRADLFEFESRLFKVER